jgi:hypothetical protein
MCWVKLRYSHLVELVADSEELQFHDQLLRVSAFYSVGRHCETKNRVLLTESLPLAKVVLNSLAYSASSSVLC